MIWNILRTFWSCCLRTSNVYSIAWTALTHISSRSCWATNPKSWIWVCRTRLFFVLVSFLYYYYMQLWRKFSCFNSWTCYMRTWYCDRGWQFSWHFLLLSRFPSTSTFLYFIILFFCVMHSWDRILNLGNSTRFCEIVIFFVTFSFCVLTTRLIGTDLNSVLQFPDALLQFSHFFFFFFMHVPNSFSSSSSVFVFWQGRLIATDC